MGFAQCVIYEFTGLLVRWLLVHLTLFLCVGSFLYLGFGGTDIELNIFPSYTCCFLVPIERRHDLSC